MVIPDMNKKLISYKLLITFLILFFNLQSSTKADNINDFDIDGISIESFKIRKQKFNWK